MAKKKKESNGNGFVDVIKKIGIVIAPILVVATIIDKVFNNNLYTKISVGVTIVLLYIISLELRLKKLEEKC
ncbi:MAG: hypothetical protein AABX85_00675 [Nanoarchaeota archaeon]